MAEELLSPDLLRTIVERDPNAALSYNLCSFGHF
jgi:hypothetical protein